MQACHSVFVGVVRRAIQLELSDAHFSIDGLVPFATKKIALHCPVPKIRLRLPSQSLQDACRSWLLPGFDGCSLGRERPGQSLMHWSNNLQYFGPVRQLQHLHTFAQTGKSDPITHRVRRILAGLSHLESELEV